ncbi:hypothetical protein PoB_000199300 [Plakobranchus ocellatus]|uniref:Syndecan/Neurexin domain-containing protein n=1 Tax=Plakobranchus ocellatus TaxID=259542 RepID=A0AAV3XZT1_9GAST|nr:hypothetical protein PoB_000199300 [Plakobranchus ocellatus]
MASTIIVASSEGISPTPVYIMTSTEGASSLLLSSVPGDLGSSLSLTRSADLSSQSLLLTPSESFLESSSSGLFITSQIEESSTVWVSPSSTEIQMESSAVLPSNSGKKNKKGHKNKNKDIDFDDYFNDEEEYENDILNDLYDQFYKDEDEEEDDDDENEESDENFSDDSGSKDDDDEEEEDENDKDEDDDDETDDEFKYITTDVEDEDEGDGDREEVEEDDGDEDEDDFEDFYKYLEDISEEDNDDDMDNEDSRDNDDNGEDENIDEAEWSDDETAMDNIDVELIDENSANTAWFQNTSTASTPSGPTESITAILVCALAAGIIFVFVVVGVLGRRIYESYRRRHYSRMDFLINGIYH